MPLGFAKEVRREDAAADLDYDGEHKQYLDDGLAEEETGSEYELFSCKYCEFETEDLEQLDEHILSHDEALYDETRASHASDGTEEDTDSNTSDHGEESEHVVTQDMPKLQSTSLGSQTSDDDHQKNNNVSVVYACPYPQCKFQSLQSKNVLNHLKKHCKSLADLVYACSECPYKARWKSDITKHLRAHCENVTYCKNLEALFFNCSQCSYTTTRRGNLRKHRICHSDSPDNLLACHLCEYTTRRKQQLKQHVIIHRNSPKYNCSECGYGSIRLYDLKTHVVLVHRDKNVKDMLKCLKCPYMSYVKISFAKHVLSSCTLVENGVTVLTNVEDRQDHEVMLDQSSEGEVDQGSPPIRLPGTVRGLKRTREEDGEPERASRVLVLERFNESREDFIV